MPVVDITELAPGGDAVGHLEISGERRAVFVRGGAVGDRLRVEIDASKRPARGSLLEVVQPSSDRVTPPCPVADRCGGCDWMHLTHDAQLRAHEDHVRRAAKETPITMHAATKTSAYRVRARLHARKGIVGPHATRSHAPVDVETCMVLHPALDRARAWVAELAVEGEVGLGLGKTGRPVLELRVENDLPAKFFGVLERQIREGMWDGARVFQGEGSRPATFGDPALWIDGADGEPLRLAPGGFSQAHAEINRALALHVASQCKDRVIELYAGAGNFTVLLARTCQVRAVESEEDACEAARANLKSRSLEAKVTCANAETFDLPKEPFTLVLDPPRTGARHVCARAIDSRTKRIVYVSCDPPSLGRDLEILSAKFSVVRADAFEMFPHTSHVESVVVLEKRR